MYFLLFEIDVCGILRQSQDVSNFKSNQWTQQQIFFEKQTVRQYLILDMIKIHFYRQKQESHTPQINPLFPTHTYKKGILLQSIIFCQWMRCTICIDPILIILILDGSSHVYVILESEDTAYSILYMLYMLSKVYIHNLTYIINLMSVFVFFG